jgi:hypothetical protein
VVVVPEFRGAENPTFSTESAGFCLTRPAQTDPSGQQAYRYRYTGVTGKNIKEPPD